MTLKNRLIVVIIFVAIYWSCSDSQTGDYKVFKYNQTDHITSLDPAFAKSQNNIWATHHIFEGLVKLDDKLNVCPALADSFSISSDGLRYTFFLNKEVYFHKNECFQSHDSTRIVTADDVVYSFARLLDPNVNSPGSWLFLGKLDSLKPFIALDSFTFQLQLEKPFLPMLGILTMQYCSVIPKEAVEFYGNKWAQNPVGTGPFVFKKWVENQALYLVKNKKYYNDNSSNLNGIKTSFIPDRKIAFLELMNNNLDFVSGLESSFAPSLLTRNGELQEKYKNTLSFTKSSYLNMEYLGINISATKEKSPLRNKKFRQALNYSIDRELMLQALRNGVGKSANAGFIPAGLPSHDPTKVNGYTYNKEKALALLKEEGYSDLSTLEPIQLYTNKDYLDLTTFIAKQWEELGLNVSIEVMESGLLRQSMRNGKLPMFRASWIADYPDGESFLCMFYSKYPAPPNYTNFTNSEFDMLYDQAIQTADVDQKIALYQKMDRLLVEEAPVIFLFYDETAIFSRKAVTGISSNAVNLLKVDSLKKGI